MTINNITNEISKSLNDEGEDRLDDFLYYMDIVCKENARHFGINPDWDNIDIRDKCYCGWLLPYTMHIETGINGRWAYWHKVKGNQTLVSNIPVITEVSRSSVEYKEVMFMINDCINFMRTDETKSANLFIDWLLWSFGSTLIYELPDGISDDMMNYWYKTFKVEALIRYPQEYLRDIVGVIDTTDTTLNLMNIKLNTLHGYLYTPWTVEI